MFSDENVLFEIFERESGKKVFVAYKNGQVAGLDTAKYGVTNHWPLFLETEVEERIIALMDDNRLRVAYPEDRLFRTALRRLGSVLGLRSSQDNDEYRRLFCGAKARLQEGEEFVETPRQTHSRHPRPPFVSQTESEAIFGNSAKT